MEKILIGFIGALIALFLAALFSRFTFALKLNRIRITIVHYLETIGKPKLERYIKDCSKAIKDVNRVHIMIEDRDEGYDDMPMLTSDIFKSFAQTELFVVMNKPLFYTELLSFTYCIDFLKKNMPVSLYNNYADRTNKHLETEKIPVGQEQFNHIKTCETIKEFRQESILEISMKINTANNAIEALQIIINEIKGNKWAWIWKYFWTF